MKQLIFDKLQRLWWIWLTYSLIFLVIGCSLPTTLKTSDFQNWWLFVYLFIFGNLATELSKGYGRIALTLPFTTRQIGQVFWLISVGIPTLLFACFGGLGILIAASKSQSSTLLAWVQMVFMGGLFFGTAFWLFSGATLNPSAKWQRRFFSGNSSAIVWMALIGVGFLLYKSKWGNEAKYAVICLLGLIFTILGWLRVEQIAVFCGEYRPASSPAQNARGQFAPPVGRGGFSYIFQTAFIRVWFTGLLLLAVMNVLDVFEKRPFDWHHLTRPITNHGAFFPFFCFLMVFSTRLFSNVRPLRTMPISTGRLAAALLGEVILPLLTFCLAITALAWHETNSIVCLSFFKIEFLAAASAAVFIAVSIWNTRANFIKVLSLVILILAIFAPALYQLTCMDGRGLPFWFVFGFTAAVLAGSHWAACQILAKSSSAYRPRQNQLGTRWNWGR